MLTAKRRVGSRSVVPTFITVTPPLPTEASHREAIRKKKKPNQMVPRYPTSPAPHAQTDKAKRGSEDTAASAG